MILLGYIIGGFLGMPLFGSFETPLSHILQCLIIGILTGISYVSIFHLITMLSSSKAASAVICLLIGFGILFLGISILDLLARPEMINQMVMKDGKEVLETVENPAYLTGMKREIYQFILDILPSGQFIQLFNMEAFHPVRMIVSSLVTTATTSCLGICLFNKKDIK